MNKGSAWIPDGLLPPTSDPSYDTVYKRLRRQLDPYQRARDTERMKKHYRNAPEYRAEQLARQRERRATMTPEEREAYYRELRQKYGKNEARKLFS